MTLGNMLTLDDLLAAAQRAIDAGEAHDGRVAVQDGTGFVIVKVCRCGKAVWRQTLCDTCDLAAWWNGFSPLRFRRLTWDGLATRWPTDLLADLEAWCGSEVTEEGSLPNLGLLGPPGRGKTAVALLLARRWYASGGRPSIRYTTHKEMATDLSRRRFRDENPFDDYTEPGWLILDDLGVQEHLSDTQQADLQMVVDIRWREERTTVWASNVGLTSLGDLIDERTLDRLKDGALVLQVGGASLRRMAS